MYAIKENPFAFPAGKVMFQYLKGPNVTRLHVFCTNIRTSLNSILKSFNCKQGVVVHTYNPSTLETELEDDEIKVSFSNLARP